MTTRAWLAWGVIAFTGLAVTMKWADPPTEPYGIALTVAALMVYGLAPEKRKP